MTSTSRNFDDFYRVEFPSMVALASTLVGRSAEDIAQEAMIRAHQRWSTVSTYDNPGTWVRRVTINLATSKLRRRAIGAKKALQLLTDTPVVSWNQTFDDELVTALRNLPGKQRAAVVLHYLEDLPVATIAEILDCAPSTAKVHLHRGRQSLAAQLGHSPIPEDATSPNTTSPDTTDLAPNASPTNASTKNATTQNAPTKNEGA